MSLQKSSDERPPISQVGDNTSTSLSPPQSSNLDTGLRDENVDTMQRNKTDNTDNANNEDPPTFVYPPVAPGDPWLTAFQEFKWIRSRLETLPKIERSTEQHTQQLGGVITKTAELETAVSSSTAKVKQLDEEIASLKLTVEKQGKIINSLKNRKDDSTDKMQGELKTAKEDFQKTATQTISEMNGLIQTQRDQIKHFNDQTKVLKQDILKGVEDQNNDFQQKLVKEVDTKVSDISTEVKYNKLKTQAFTNKLNLVITGLREDPNKAPLTLAKDYFSSMLKIKDLELDVAYRLGAAPTGDSSYSRPLVVRFPQMFYRDKVWKNKTDFTEEDGNIIRIHADLPKRLRDDSQLLYRVQKAAAKIPRYKSAKVKDYKLLLNGNEYAPNQLESLPEPIRPSFLASPQSDQAVAFFSRHSVFSNHYQSPFTVKGVKFGNMEQFLAYRKACFTEHDYLAAQALETQDPAEAKAILNKLKKNCPRQWYDKAPEIVAEGLREKFKQNQYLLELLISTRGLKLGEASRDTFWGVGMTLTDPQVLDHTKWPPNGNLLGRSLMKIREEIRAKASAHASPSKQKTPKK